MREDLLERVEQLLVRAGAFSINRNGDRPWGSPSIQTPVRNTFSPQPNAAPCGT